MNTDARENGHPLKLKHSFDVSKPTHFLALIQASIGCTSFIELAAHTGAPSAQTLVRVLRSESSGITDTFLYQVANTLKCDPKLVQATLEADGYRFASATGRRTAMPVNHHQKRYRQPTQRISIKLNEAVTKGQRFTVDQTDYLAVYTEALSDGRTFVRGQRV
jgi:hypothetical protein